ncbi:hypothetical protein PVAND_004921 [Polypedilum vanderplanki]|uniref:Uncharacterized protein n=1 Tax=Polypedilum vanderplanki TaxID=319348 RepID=A0A9J6BZI8_POLVA|nr:hypothetical protein PVAND_004921 [Polypedilum vanderplanki]
MWAMETREIKNYILNYKTGKFKEIKHDKDETCEDFCKELCRRWNFPPLVQLLFGLRLHGTKIWLGSARQLVADKHYEFRIRIKIPKLADLNKHDKNTFDYFYHQVRYDVLHNDIPGLINENTRNKILGLCVTDMYVEMLENENKDYPNETSRKKAREEKMKYLNVNYKNYIPRFLYEKHWVILQMRIKKSLKGVDYKHDPLYVKTSYIQQVDSMAPNYLIEEYWGKIAYPQEDHMRQGTCRVRLQIAPYDKEQPGLRMHYAYKDTWRHISTFADFYAIQIDADAKQVRLEIQNSPQGFPITMDSIEEIESFVNCMNIYYRLTVKWTWYLCELLKSPSLDFLNKYKIHGPIGGGYSYNRIKEIGKGVGTYIIRQCEKEFDIYYIDILTKKNQSCETFKINGAAEKWQLYDNENNEISAEFDNLVSLAKSIPVESGVYNRLPPSCYEKPPLLLLCQTNIKSVPASATNTTMITTTQNSPGGLRTQRPVVFTNEDFRMYIPSTREINDEAFEQRKAEYRDRNTEVTLKLLKTTEKLTEFHLLADKWSKLDISEIVKLNGIILNPVALVLEPLKYGPLDIFLRTHEFRRQVVPLNLVETAYSLARALHYLQEKQIVHGRIKCSSLEVIKFDPGNSFEVKLGDPGLPRDLKVRDVPWIPIEDYDDLNNSRNNLKADIWAYATTLWEIFSRGESPFTELSKVPNITEFFRRGDRLPKPKECELLPRIYEIMKSGWEVEPEKRFAPQTIFSPLLDISRNLSRHYESPISSNPRSNGTMQRMNGGIRNGRPSSSNSMFYNNGSLVSNETDQTYISSLMPGTLHTNAYIDGGSSIDNSSQISLLNGHSIASNGSHSTTNAFIEHNFDGECMELDDNRKLSFRGYIGSGNFGVVYKGTIGPLIFNPMEDEEEEVAIKCFKPIDSLNQAKDFLREVRMMKALNHENIVKIYDFHEDWLLIIMEYMSGGSLQEFVAIHRHELTVDDILQFALHIAKGMHYLEQNKIVHRDLAARNVLVTRNSSLLLSDTVCKIADFGLAQFTNHYGYYESTNNRDLPLQWYAPETISCLKFSSKNDVWSFGITLWEMFSFGDTPRLVPKSDFKGEDLLQALEKGERLKCPKHCPQNIYEELMRDVCWSYNSDKRPNFAGIIEKIRNLLIRNGELV